MRNLLLTIAATTLIFSCAFQSSKIQLSTEGLDNFSAAEKSTWIHYGNELIQCVGQTDQVSFHCEVKARSAAAIYWSNLKHKTTTSKYFIELQAAIEAGYSREYVWYYHKQKNWSFPDNLKNSHFNNWKSVFLINHIPTPYPGKIKSKQKN